MKPVPEAGQLGLLSQPPSGDLVVAFPDRFSGDVLLAGHPLVDVGDAAPEIRQDPLGLLSRLGKVLLPQADALQSVLCARVLTVHVSSAAPRLVDGHVHAPQLAPVGQGSQGGEDLLADLPLAKQAI